MEKTFSEIVKERGQSKIINLSKEEIKRSNEITLVNGGTYGHIGTKVNNQFNDYIDYINLLGIKVIEDVTSELEMPYNSNYFDAVSFLAEEESYVINSGITTTKDTLKAHRFVWKNKYTNELLASTDALNLMYVEAMYNINLKAIQEIINIAKETTSISGSTSTDWISLLNEVDSKGLINPYVVTTKDNYLGSLTGTTGNDNTIKPYAHLMGKVLGCNIWGTDLITDDKSIFIDFGRSYIIWYNDLEITFNPYKYADEGYTEVQFVRYGDVSVNPYGVTVVG